MSIETPKLKIEEPQESTSQEPAIEAKPKFQFGSDIHFRSADGNFNVLTKGDRSFTGEDVSHYGFYTNSNKIDFSFSRLLDGLTMDLRAPGGNMPAERKAIVESLLQGRPTFVPIDVTRVDQEFLTAVNQFKGARLALYFFQRQGR